MKIGKKNIGLDYPAFLIAEAGVNHNGSIRIAKKLIDVANVVLMLLNFKLLKLKI